MNSRDSQAAAVHGDAVRDGEGRSERWRVNRDAAAFAMKIERLDGPEMFDDSREHVACAASPNECTAFRDEG